MLCKFIPNPGNTGFLRRELTMATVVHARHSVGRPTPHKKHDWRGWIPASDMTLSSILFNPHARVYNLRFLLLSAIASTALHAYNRVLWRHNENSIPLWLSMFFCLFVPVRHLAVLFKWPGNWLAITDLAMHTMEIGVTSNIVYYIYDNKEMTLDTPVPVICLLVALVVSAIFRAATMYTAEGRLSKQPFDFFGGCALVKPGYTAWSIPFPGIVAFIGELGDGTAEKDGDVAERGVQGPGNASEKTPLLGGRK
ncbi:hypothetical protein C8F01DRAFT_194187 [Mycena amicta]|nr:hypothetical protein C8F01DRAFT_194187 [Mycena amicta]